MRPGRPEGTRPRHAAQRDWRRTPSHWRSESAQSRPGPRCVLAGRAAGPDRALSDRSCHEPPSSSCSVRRRAMPSLISPHRAARRGGSRRAPRAGKPTPGRVLRVSAARPRAGLSIRQAPDRAPQCARRHRRGTAQAARREFKLSRGLPARPEARVGSPRATRAASKAAGDTHSLPRPPGPVVLFPGPGPGPGPRCGSPLAQRRAGEWPRPLSESARRPAPCPSHAAPEAEAGASTKLHIRVTYPSRIRRRRRPPAQYPHHLSVAACISESLIRVAYPNRQHLSVGLPAPSPAQGRTLKIGPPSNPPPPLPPLSLPPQLTGAP